MKAILLIDVHEFTYEAIKEYFTGVITLHLGNDGFIDFKDVALEPMPQKKNSIVYQGEVNVDIPVDFLEKIHNQGYNKCIDEILGGEE